MTEISLKFGKETLQMQLRDEILTGVLEGSFPPSPTPAEEQKTIVDSLRNPINSKPLAKIVQPGQKVVIMCSDITPVSYTHLDVYKRQTLRFFLH